MGYGTAVAKVTFVSKQSTLMYTIKWNSHFLLRETQKGYSYYVVFFFSSYCDVWYYLSCHL